MHHPASTDIPVTLCFGDTYNENGFNVTADEVGSFTYTQNLETFHGCDSTVTLYVTVNPLSTAEYTDETCDRHKSTIIDESEVLIVPAGSDDSVRCVIQTIFQQIVHTASRREYPLSECGSVCL